MSNPRAKTTAARRKPRSQPAATLARCRCGDKPSLIVSISTLKPIPKTARVECDCGKKTRWHRSERLAADAWRRKVAR